MRLVKVQRRCVNSKVLKDDMVGIRPPHATSIKTYGITEYRSICPTNIAYTIDAVGLIFSCFLILMISKVKGQRLFTHLSLSMLQNNYS